MKNPLFLKICLLVLIGIALMVPITMIERTISERTEYRDYAVDAISNSFSGAQMIHTPVLVFPVLEEYDEISLKTNPQGELEKGVMIKKRRWHHLVILPKTIHFMGEMKADKRAYGIYEAAIFELSGQFSGGFDAPTSKNLPEPGMNGTFSWGAPYLRVVLGDARGILGQPTIQLGAQALDLEKLKEENGQRGRSQGTSFSAQLEAPHDGKARYIPFEMKIALAGTSQFSFIPLGGDTDVQIKGNWPHPSFVGNYLPREREVGPDGFSARWSTSSLASSSNDISGFSVKIIDPVDVYRQSTRAIKYGSLFIVLCFTSFFIFEYTKRLPIHPIQYLLVGLAQAVFFLLLVSLSEHINFSWAYLIGSLASILLISVYLASVLKDRWDAIKFSIALGVLYAALFGILRSEDNALLLGSVLLFLALTALMMSTRNIDWYHIPLKKSGAAGASGAEIIIENDLLSLDEAKK